MSAADGCPEMTWSDSACDLWPSWTPTTSWLHTPSNTSRQKIPYAPILAGIVIVFLSVSSMIPDKAAYDRPSVSSEATVPA